MIASIIDCHSTGTAAAAAYKAEGRSMESDPPLRFVTASLHVDYLKPTPVEYPIIVKASVTTHTSKKTIVFSELYSNEILRARGTVVAVLMPEDI